MNLSIKKMSAITAVTVCAGLVTVMAGPALAAPPPWEPDTNARGNVTFYDASGAAITSGSINAPLAFVATNAPPRSGDNIATLFGAVATVGENPGIWPAEQMSGATNNPDTSAPAPLNTTPDMVFDSASGEETIATLMTDLPVPAADAGTAYNDVYQIRITTSSAANGLDALYWESDITVNPAAGTWTQLFPAAVATNTSTVLTANPPVSQTVGGPVNLTATLSPSNAVGSVTFEDGSTPIGSAVSVTAGVATTSTSSLTTGSHSLSAVFTPTDPTAFATSTSPVVSYSIVAAAAQNTTTSLAVDTGAGTAFSPVTFTATVSPSGAGGTVAFSESPTGTALGSAPVNAGTAVLVDGGLAAGPHNVIATFTPSNPAAFNGSVSPAVPFTLGAQSFMAASTWTSTLLTTVPAGTLTISTPYGNGQGNNPPPLNLGAMTLNASGTEFSVTGTFANIVITDTRSGALPITAKAQSSNLVDGTGTIDAQNVGLTSLVPVFIAGNGIQAGQVTTFDNPAAPGVAPGAPGSAGLGGGFGHTIASVTHGPGSFSMNGTLTVNAPSSTPASAPGTFYAGTITFTAG